MFFVCGHRSTFVFQLMFCTTTTTIISGAVASRYETKVGGFHFLWHRRLTPPNRQNHV